VIGAEKLLQQSETNEWKQISKDSAPLVCFLDDLLKKEDSQIDDCCKEILQPDAARISFLQQRITFADFDRMIMMNAALYPSDRSQGRDTARKLYININK